MKYSITATLNGNPIDLNGRVKVSIQKFKNCVVRLKRLSAEEIEEAIRHANTEINEIPKKLNGKISKKQIASSNFKTKSRKPERPETSVAKSG